MSVISRANFTYDEKTKLAMYLASLPQDQRKSKNTFEVFARKNPSHSFEAWRSLVLKKGDDVIEKMIMKYVRENDRDNKNNKAKKPNRPVIQRTYASGSGKAGYTEEEVQIFIEGLVSVTAGNQTKARLYDDLAQGTSHSASSWQTYYRDHKAELDAAASELFRERKKEEKKRWEEMNRVKQKKFDAQNAEDQIQKSKGKGKEKARESSSDEDEDEDEDELSEEVEVATAQTSAPSVSDAASKKRRATPVVTLDGDHASPPKKKKASSSEPSPKASGSGERRTATTSGGQLTAPTSSPSRRPASPAGAPSSAPPENDVDLPDEAEWTDEDDFILAKALVKAQKKDFRPGTAYEMLQEKHGRSVDAWRERHRSNMSRIALLMYQVLTSLEEGPTDVLLPPASNAPPLPPLKAASPAGIPPPTPSASDSSSRRSHEPTSPARSRSRAPTTPNQLKKSASPPKLKERPSPGTEFGGRPIVPAHFFEVVQVQPKDASPVHLKRSPGRDDEDTTEEVVVGAEEKDVEMPEEDEHTTEEAVVEETGDEGIDAAMQEEDVDELDEDEQMMEDRLLGEVQNAQPPIEEAPFEEDPDEKEPLEEEEEEELPAWDAYAMPWDPLGEHRLETESELDQMIADQEAEEQEEEERQAAEREAVEREIAQREAERLEIIEKKKRMQEAAEKKIREEKAAAEKQARELKAKKEREAAERARLEEEEGEREEREQEELVRRQAVEKEAAESRRRSFVATATPRSGSANSSSARKVPRASFTAQGLLPSPAPASRVASHSATPQPPRKLGEELQAHADRFVLKRRVVHQLYTRYSAPMDMADFVSVVLESYTSWLTAEGEEKERLGRELDKLLWLRRDDKVLLTPENGTMRSRIIAQRGLRAVEQRERFLRDLGKKSPEDVEDGKVEKPWRNL